MPQTSPMSWLIIISLLIIAMVLSKSMMNWNLKTKQSKEKKKKSNLLIKWKF